MRERNVSHKSNGLTSGSPGANPKSGPDFSVFIKLLYIYIQFYISDKMLSHTPRITRTQG
jgi:hypothetical protein